MERKGTEEFLRLVTENKAVQEDIKSIGSDMDALAEYAHKQGYDVSPQELREYRERLLKLMGGRLKHSQRLNSALSSGARDFYALIKLAETDEETAKRLEELNTGTPEELIAFGKEKGFVFNEQDMQDFGKGILEQSDELDDEELELVAGGTTVLVAFGVGAILVLGIAAMGGAFIAFGVVGKF